ncbi:MULTISPECIES: zinc-binding dehydrogenase [unclassified Breznakia]|uniref:zinc-binding dehydrogenase n=1 Tax=unclassified Breznakia TaxID=2623764 RepID=UPI002475E234|nr:MULTISPECIES: zinc-binding dehydrogenase [unclassified Breznakia]MDH6368073.1 threonine dehydrogenase-like Zn-dependent dehydrogenase [Breznakia sp. PH1-1]MDH6405166.1 threonine dehydrogenase-like Zn-dependent dehydrogenase [Breznakia sp. PF1-11]MDH6412876.1 threonine dehydrogenase-like Zn-dependent dehydrogenase [Breznakia sp. PFB1-11]MDH6415242.1 threonine dehydrogenase-like Zn-dependent dehydrogenase [Breznakia sp. PFB1-14]MDH6417552.1 threonine dehydrogenase-like Zn-dependent dehydrogen
MKTKAVRLYGVDDLRLEEFELPEIKDDEILVRVVSDSICMSTYKTVKQGKNHKRVPDDVDKNPIIIGHEFAGDIVKVGKKWQDQFKAGQRFAQQPALNYKGSLASPGYSYPYFGGDCTYCIIPPEVMELGCLMVYEGDSYYSASLGEPMSCIIGGYRANYHTNKQNYVHDMGIKEGGNLLIMGGTGPMGLGAIDYAAAGDKKPKRVVVTDLSEQRIERARRVLSEVSMKEKGIELIYFNPNNYEDDTQALLDISEGKGYDDIFVYVPVESLAQQASKLLAFDGCMNIFAGPTDKNFSAMVNLYDVHYTSTHIMGTTGGTNDDLLEALRLSEQGKINPSLMVTHIGGLDSVVDTTINLPDIPGGKKLIYTQIDLPLTAIDDFESLAKEDPLFAKLHESCEAHNGLWNVQAEQILLNHFNVNQL